MTTVARFPLPPTPPATGDLAMSEEAAAELFLDGFQAARDLELSDSGRYWARAYFLAGRQFQAGHPELAPS